MVEGGGGDAPGLLLFLPSHLVSCLLCLGAVSRVPPPPPASPLPLLSSLHEKGNKRIHEEVLASCGALWLSGIAGSD